MGSEGFRWLWRVKQDGMVVASGDAPDRRAADRELAHYAMVYGQDGPVTVETRTGKNKWRVS